MHELSLVDTIVKDISALAGKENFHHVSQIRLEIGSMSGVIPESIEFCFSELAKGTVLDGATLVVQKVALKVRCEHCEVESEPDIDAICCQRCGLNEVTIIAGKDFKIIDLEVD